MWDDMRALAIERHRFLWILFGSNPLEWPYHMWVVRSVYGY